MNERPLETEYSALQALLQIRTNQGDGNAAVERQSVGSNEVTGGVSAAQTAATANLASLLRLGVSTGSLLQQAAHHMSLTPTQLAAVRAAASLGLSRNGFLQELALQHQTFMASAASASSTNRHAATTLHQHSSPLLDAISRDNSLGPSAAAVTAAPLTPALELPRSPVLLTIQSANEEARSPVPKSLTMPAAYVEGSNKHAELDESEKKIRKEEVAAALKSKPQRGRKRENLNAEERLELTRTRNREHAKSTRVRKKARYQELLDTEQKYHELMSEAELDANRRDAVVNFLEARARMLNSAVQVISREANQHTRKESQLGSEARAISFDRAEGYETEGALVGTEKAQQELNGSLHGILENVRAFRFETTLGDIHVCNYDAMTLFDKLIAQRFKALPRRGSSCELNYRVVRSIDGIALNKDGTGFAKVELVVVDNSKCDPSDTASPTEKEKVLQSSVVSFQFAGTSSMISSVLWCIMKDAIDAEASSESVNESKSDVTAKESLESQTVYPSVVSFDESHREKARDSATPTPEHQQQQESAGSTLQSEENPGMTI